MGHVPSLIAFVTEEPVRSEDGPLHAGLRRRLGPKTRDHGRRDSDASGVHPCRLSDDGRRRPPYLVE